MLIIEITLLISVLIGFYLAIWIIREVRLSTREVIKFTLSTVAIVSVCLLIFSSSQKDRVDKLIAKIENDGGKVNVKAQQWVDKLPSGIKPVLDSLAGGEEFSVDFRNTNIRDISYLKGLPSLTSLDLRGTYITNFQLQQIQRRFPSCEIFSF